AITIVRIVADVQRRAVLEDHARRAFDLDREQVERILEPADFKFLPVERAGLDGAAVVVGHELVVGGAASDAHAFVRKRDGGGVVPDGDQIARPAVDRDMEFGAREARARNDRLEIAGEKPIPVHVTCGTYAGLAPVPRATRYSPMTSFIGLRAIAAKILELFR